MAFFFSPCVPMAKFHYHTPNRDHQQVVVRIDRRFTRFLLDTAERKLTISRVALYFIHNLPPPSKDERPKASELRNPPAKFRNTPLSRGVDTAHAHRPCHAACERRVRAPARCLPRSGGSHGWYVVRLERERPCLACGWLPNRPRLPPGVSTVTGGGTWPPFCFQLLPFLDVLLVGAPHAACCALCRLLSLLPSLSLPPSLPLSLSLSLSHRSP